MERKIHAGMELYRQEQRQEQARKQPSFHQHRCQLGRGAEGARHCVNLTARHGQGGVLGRSRHRCRLGGPGKTKMQARLRLRTPPRHPQMRHPSHNRLSIVLGWVRGAMIRREPHPRQKSPPKELLAGSSVGCVTMQAKGGGGCTATSSSFFPLSSNPLSVRIFFNSATLSAFSPASIV